jgi:hypothetical protein
MDRDSIVRAIRQAADANGGVMPGQRRFERTSGITPSMWRGKYWARWADAVASAGLTAGQMNEAHSDEHLLSHLARLVIARGRYPTEPEIQLARTENSAFPSHKTFGRFGNKVQRIERLRAFCQGCPEFKDVLKLLPSSEPKIGTASEDAAAVEKPTLDGYVYMMKLGKHYKIGKTFAVPQRHRQIALELPEKPDVVHALQTDDPEGIEAYWHRRFAQKRTNGEWFALDAQDVRAFRRRKFM